MTNHQLKVVSIVLGVFCLFALGLMVLAGVIVAQDKDRIINSKINEPTAYQDVEKERIVKNIETSTPKEQPKLEEPLPEQVTDEEKQVLREQTEWTLGKLKATGQYFNVLINEHGERLIWTCEDPSNQTFTKWESQINNTGKSTMAVVVGSEVILATGIRINEEVKVIPNPEKHLNNLKTMVTDINDWLTQYQNQPIEVLTENKVIYQFVVPSNALQCPK